MDALIEDKKSLLQRFILWREKRIKEKHLSIISRTIAWSRQWICF